MERVLASDLAVVPCPRVEAILWDEFSHSMDGGTEWRKEVSDGIDKVNDALERRVDLISTIRRLSTVAAKIHTTGKFWSTSQYLGAATGIGCFLAHLSKKFIST